MEQNKKQFKAEAIELAKAKGISIKKARQLLYTENLFTELKRYNPNEPKGQIAGKWKDVLKD